MITVTPPLEPDVAEWLIAQGIELRLDEGLPYRAAFERPCRYADRPHHHENGYQSTVTFGPVPGIVDNYCQDGTYSRCPDRPRPTP